MRNKNKKKMSGQVVLMVLLASALILTLGLSASRITTTETKIDTDQEMLKKAFNAAESGIDYYMATGSTGVSAYKSGDGSANLQISSIGETRVLYFDEVTMVGQLQYFWLVNHNADGSIGSNYYSTTAGVGNTISVCGSNTSVTPLKIDYFYLDTGNNYAVERTVANTNALGCASFNITSGSRRSLLLTVMPIDLHSKLSIRGAINFPSQGERVSSTGSVSGINNTVTVLNRYRVDLFLTEALVSGGQILSGDDGSGN